MFNYHRCAVKKKTGGGAACAIVAYLPCLVMIISVVC